MAKKKSKKRNIPLSMLIKFLILAVVVILSIFLFKEKGLDHIRNKYQDSKYLSLNSINIDHQTAVLFAKNNSLYSLKLDGTKPKRITVTKDYIRQVKYLSSNDSVFLQTTRPELIEKIHHGPKRFTPVYDYHYKNWILENGSTSPRSIEHSFDWENRESYYTEANHSGGVDIMMKEFDSSVPVKLGSLTQKPIRRQICEAGCQGNPYEYVFPHTFLPSFDGNYLLSIPGGGGGLGEPGVVISRDGRYIYDIDFYWYVSDAIWIDDNRILSKDQNGAKIFTFQSDGKHDTKALPDDIVTGFFNQKYLSPSKSYLYLEDLRILNLKTMTSESIDGMEDIKDKKITFIGWNRNSDKILLNTAPEDSPSVKNKIILYDIHRKQTYTIATANNQPSWAVESGIGFSDIFDIQ